MPNQVSICPTEFVNPKTGEKTFGIRVYDNYSQAYDNTWESIPYNDFEILKMVIEHDDSVISDMMVDVESEKMGIYIGDNFYEWSEIKRYFE